MKALILSIRAGYGHHSTGQAVMHMLEARGFSCTMLDTFEYINPHLANSISDGYLFSTKYLPEAYGKAYDTLDKREQRYDKHSLISVLSKVVSHKLREFFLNYVPDVVIGTHSYACMLITYMREKGYINCPTYGIITDFTVHPFWESTDLDYYVTPDQLLMRQMQKKGIPPEKVLPYGIPIKEKFSRKLPQEEARKRLGLANKTTILMMMGSMGFGNIEKNLRQIDSLKEDFQILCICGNNEKMRKTVEETAWNHHIPAYGFVDNVDEMMDAADCIITKPGGLTTSEFLAKGLPAIILDPIPGQEDRNMEFLVNNGAAMMVTSTFPPDEAVHEMLHYPWRFALLKQAAQKLGKPESTRQLCDFIVDHLNQ